jgi:hypothetical protein
MGDNIDFELIERVIGNGDTSVFKNLNYAETLEVVRNLNAEWEREGNGLTEAEILEAASDIYDTYSEVGIEEENWDD